MGRNKLLDHRVKQVSEIMVPDHSVPGDGAMSWKIATSMHAPAQPTSLVADAHLQPVAGGGWKSVGERACFALSPSLLRSDEHTSELQSLMRHSYAVFCLNKHNHKQQT